MKSMYDRNGRKKRSLIGEEKILSRQEEMLEKFLKEDSSKYAGLISSESLEEISDELRADMERTRQKIASYVDMR
jgi:hypothetical protein